MMSLPITSAPMGEPLAFDLLDLNTPGLAAVRENLSSPNAAAAKLLTYYRQRTSVRHPCCIEKISLASLDTSVLNTADDALRNTLITSPKYPRYAFGDTIDWLTNQAQNKDYEWLVQLNRHDSWGAMSEVYAATGDDRYPQCYVRQLKGWIGQCPINEDSDAWRTIEAGIRGHAWTFHFLRFVRSLEYTPEALLLQLRSFHDHAVILTSILNKRKQDESKGLKSNWALMEAEGLAFIAVTFPEFRESVAWLSLAVDCLNRAVEEQVRSDGHQVELCLGYHMGCINWFSRTAQLLALNGKGNLFPDSFWKRIEAMCEVPMKLGLPNGSNTQFGDDHSQFGWRETLGQYATLFKRDDLLFAATGGKKGKMPAATAFSLPLSGFYSMRSGWTTDAAMLVLKCGPDGGWHCQPDNGTFEIFAGGRRLTPDAGSYIYSGDTDGRAWFRQSRVHQTLTLDGRDIAYAPRLRLFKPDTDTDVLVVENESYEKTTHRRSVFFVKKKYFVLVDELLGEPRGNAWLHFQFPPTTAILDSKALSAHTGFEKGMNLLIQAMPQPGLGLSEEEGRVSFKYASQEPRPALRFEIPQVSAPVRFVTILVPYTGKIPSASAGIRNRIGSNKMDLEVTVEGKKAMLGYSLD
ncbi:MAG: hypothetical protein A2268_06930 [Candidatus Raymondbacteria bacterium RifOxyA12_full_50_37]|uniref:Uncharacterized protein n=1 Tax=Candidatus Raymondbacteria bacterium RIFOXYD12_FULL_49_13 TaxID=1817890 RepID=A0A1F7FEB0_UNCRA|nr:MAG: hypothetical protein A2268_06930 [Candidatus Raymondbacteria bacterium RifOxyA12_full_50_37]OGJ91121.1 MAG: hypothetical protein A2248_01085 [Candidatus Raymondbacteria bacterium RIFOXYA2_FULL_49_16]OGJ97518.1 MAG: hypothetical protein A2453_01845 [Candidatus Raymondbacteria bacterium RIFOXYC2_FULL_50_21]OGK00178.1 MAG: hypothetical protein A2350_16455 [Candidatus Raymondbacteria bacterium RifOxyB12_full_50_8]OGK04993.1 MAG: hypothetical protein A2519_09955 [Candidatus Raymondbacteria b